jgi:protoheme IX farnesyltransferase
MEKIKKYYSLTKPGVLYGNALTAIAGFLLAVAGKEGSTLMLFIAFFIGITLVIASACVLNNYLDRDIDSKMERTKTRVSVKGSVSERGMIIFSIVLGIVGIALLFFYTNLLTTLLAAFGFLDYVVFYGMWSKRTSVHGTLVGSISGAIPILTGFTAVTGTISIGATLVFLTLFFWQFPEFYSISIYRREEYKNAEIPVISVVKGVRRTKSWILIHTLLFVFSTLLLTLFAYTGIIYFVVMALLGLYFIWLAVKGTRTEEGKETDSWAREMFHFSLIILLVYSFMLAISPIFVLLGID